MVQTATTGNLANAQRIVVNTTRYTEEHNAPAMALTEQFSLGKGNKSVTVPKVAQMTIVDLVDGQDIVDTEEIGMTTVDLTAAEVGAKVVLTDVLVLQSVDNVFRMVGRQLGDGMARKKDQDVIALYSGLNGGVALGATTKPLSAPNWAGCIAHAKAQKFGMSSVYGIHHPNAIANYIKQAAITGTTLAPADRGYTVDLIKNFYSGLRPLNGIPLFEDGNITEDGNGDGEGAIASRDAMATLNSVKMKTERQRDASLRGTEVVMTAHYGVFELDETKGAPMLYAVSAPSTSA